MAKLMPRQDKERDFDIITDDKEIGLKGWLSTWREHRIGRRSPKRIRQVALSVRSSYDYTVELLQTPETTLAV